MGKIHAETFDELFEGTKALPWEDFIPEDGKFWVAKANSIKSKLFSPSDIQSIMKKAMVERLKTVYHRDAFRGDRGGISDPRFDFEGRGVLSVWTRAAFLFIREATAR